MQLERSIATLRELAAHVASNETVNSLAAHVQSLGAKVDQLAISGASAAFSSPSIASTKSAARSRSARRRMPVCPGALRR